MNYETAVEYSNEIINLLFHYCMRIEPTGAVRRREAHIDFLEMTASPQIISENSFWNNQADGRDREIYESNRLQARVDLLARNNILKKVQDGPSPAKINRPLDGAACYSLQYKQVGVLIYSVIPPSEWGVECLLRTGDEGFLNFLVERAARKGLAITDGHLEKMGMPLSTPEEADVFRALDLEWIEPENRSRKHLEEMDAVLRKVSIDKCF